MPRRRRHATFHMTPTRIELNPRRPHFQSREHNSLNGGEDRWFEPAATGVIVSRPLFELLKLCRSVIHQLEGPCASKDQLVEMHQFRIEPSASKTRSLLRRDYIETA